MKKRFLLLLLIVLTLPALSQDIFRFEHLNTRNGLSQNTVFSIHCDKKGFLWIGTMNGLNRYDGYEFKVFKSKGEKSDLFTNNRVTNIWEDKQGFIWMESYDGYYHFFNPKSETFTTLPRYSAYEEEKNSTATCFLQYSTNEIWVGSTNTGIFRLSHAPDENTYTTSHYLSRGNNAISNNNIRFIYADRDSNIWIGTQRGINFLSAKDYKNNTFMFQHLNVDVTFSKAVNENDREIWFGTESNGLLCFNKSLKTFTFKNCPNNNAPQTPITHIVTIDSNRFLVGSEGNGIATFNTHSNTWQQLPFHDQTPLNIYADRFNQFWVTGKAFGVTRIDGTTLQSHYYELTPNDNKYATDLERQYFYEDKQNQLWIGLHGAGLANFNRATNQFYFYRNNPADINSLASNVVHCITEDHTGNMWIGTGQNKGGMAKIIRSNPAIKHLLTEPTDNSQNANNIRAVIEDSNNIVWAGTKNGKLYLFEKNKKEPFHAINILSYNNAEKKGNNVYCITQDQQGYIWLGTKGEGLGVSSQPITRNTNYKTINFNWYKHKDNDTTSLTNDNIYSIAQSGTNTFIIGTYGNGISVARRNANGELTFTNINTHNSNLSSNQIRHLLIDSRGNLWVATPFGINYLDKINLDKQSYRFTTIFHDPQSPSSLSYNDVIYIFEDNSHTMWFTTFGGGVNQLEKFEKNIASFKHYTSNEGMGNDVVYAALQDNQNNLWFSTENGLSKLDKKTDQIEVYNENNLLYFNIFAESTCYKTREGSLLFGGNMGLILIQSDIKNKVESTTKTELTNLYLANKEVTVHSPNTPLKTNIGYTDKLVLTHNQNSFRIEYSSLEFSDPTVVQYAYILDNFDKEWNYVGNLQRAIYTNLSPGTYTFRVKSTSSFGQWNQPERILTIRILPPWYQTWWAYLIFVIITAITIFIVHRTLTQLNHFRHDLLLEKKINQLKLQFFTNVSHEIRTPLTLIIGPLDDILNNKKIPETVTKQLRVIRKNAQRMLMLTNQLLDFRKVQNNKMILQVSEINIEQFTRDIFSSFEPLAVHKQIVYTYTNQCQDGKVWADASRLDIIIYNLLSNALKFTDPGKKVTIAITDNNTQYKITVIDEGRGIAPDMLNELFSRYTILSTNELSGTGIGLSLSYELAKLHGGNILVESQPGIGSTFSLLLPKGNAHFVNNPNVTIVNKPTERTTPLEEISIIEQPDDTLQSEEGNIALVVEDNPEILDYICQSLRPEFKCIKAVNGEEALNLAKQFNPQIVITDVMMPVMNGIEMTRKLKENFNTSHLPVIMLTAKSDADDQITGIETGAEAYITKPFNVDYLKTVALNLIQQRNKVLSFVKNNKSIEPGTIQITSKDEEFLNKLIDYINNNYSNDISIDQMADYCCLSRTVFYNKIKSLSGQSPIDFLRQIKLKIAAQLLEKGYNVSEVAFKVGYNDVKYFSRQFKAMYGYTPSKHQTTTTEE